LVSEKMYDKLAELVVKKGVNVQKDQHRKGNQNIDRGIPELTFSVLTQRRSFISGSNSQHPISS
jgi:hypothetical protein